MRFEELELSDNVLDALYDMRFDTCTPIQEKCIPIILEGRDLIGVAQTGTGKTAAYLLPILSKLDEGNYPTDRNNCLVMSPTRELAQQIDQAMEGFSYYLQDVSSVAIYGGNDGNRYDQELKSLRLGADVVIATPGRLISHIQMGNVDFSHVSFFVLDEADRMLDMGFYDDIITISKELPDNCQTIMFSATMPKKIEELAQTLLKNPESVKLAVSKPADKIKQSAFICYEQQKLPLIRHIFAEEPLKRVIIFTGKKQKAKAINRALIEKGINSGEMHSDLQQAERDEMMYKFKSGQIDVLVATDILSRGIDIDDISMVINFDVPHDPEDYVHRIGRTARADRDGRAISFVSENDMYLFKEIERFLEKEVEKNTMPEELGEGPDYSATSSKGQRGKRGRYDDKRRKNNRKPRDNREDKDVATDQPQGNVKPEDTKQEANPKDEAHEKSNNRKRRKPKTHKPDNAEADKQNTQEPKARQKQEDNKQPAKPSAEGNREPNSQNQGEGQPAKPKKRRKPRKYRPKGDKQEGENQDLYHSSTKSHAEQPASQQENAGLTSTIKKLFARINPFKK